MQADAFRWKFARGTELVIEPDMTQEPKTNQPKWLMEIPEWLMEWLTRLQQEECGLPFYLMACSRGAAWGLKLLETSLTFRRAVLIAPYYQQQWKGYEDQLERAIERRLQPDPTSIKIVYGTADQWLPPQSLIRLMKDKGAATSVIELEGLNHNDTIGCNEKYWSALTGP